MTTVDQQKIRRTRTGLIAHDPTRVQPGYTLFAPMFGDGTVYLVDMDGEVAHTWRLPYRPGLYGYLLDDGHLFYGGKVMEDLTRFEAWPRFKARRRAGGRTGAVGFSGRSGTPTTITTRAGCATATCSSCACARCPPTSRARSAAACQAPRPTARSTPTTCVEMTTRGEVVWEWRSWEHLDPATYPITPQDRRAEWTHGNTVAETARRQHRRRLPQHLDRRHDRARQRGRSSGNSAARRWRSSTTRGRCRTATS